jgi:hypothetical protein
MALDPGDPPDLLEDEGEFGLSVPSSSARRLRSARIDWIQAAAQVMRMFSAAEPLTALRSMTTIGAFRLMPSLVGPSNIL